jgi:hypothetical protein
LQLRSHLILCFRAEQKIEMKRGQDGKMEIVPKQIASGFSDWIPICEKNMLYELTASFLLVPGKPGIPHPIKLQEQLRKILDLSQPLNEAVGTHLAQWAKGTAPIHEEGATASAEAASEAGKPAHASPAAPSAPSDDPAEFWRAKLRTCERSSRVINNVYNVIPEEIRQDCFACYSDQLKGLKAK